jgi:hypothetical protein
MSGETQNLEPPVSMTKTSEFDRFDLEQGIMQCWNMVDDVRLLARRGASSADFEALASVYHHKFEELWAQFENGVHERKIT